MMAWLPGFVGYRTQWLSLSFTTLFLKLEGRLGERVCLMLEVLSEREGQTVNFCVHCINVFVTTFEAAG